MRPRPRARIFRGRVAREGAKASLSDEWRAWIAENLLLRTPRADVVSLLVEQGVPQAVAEREVLVIERSPLLLGARKVARIVRRFEIVARLRRELEKVKATPSEVERRSQLSLEELVGRYYAGSTPVLLPDALAPWPGLARWSPAFLKERFGDARVEISSGRDADDACDANWKAHVTPITLGELADRVVASSGTNDFYLVANNHAMERAALEPLLDDVKAPHPYLEPRRSGDCISLWFGPQGTVTSLHHDTTNVLFCQVFGKKKVTLIPPDELLLTRPIHSGVFSVVDPEALDLEAFPELLGMRKREVIVAPGEALFIPVGWWHHVRALEPSISLAFTNMRLPNRFDWYYPGMME
jgi:hypothetical protein